MEATNFVKTVETHQHQKDCMPRRDRIFKSLDHKGPVIKDIEPLKKNQYGQYLMDVMAGKFLDK